MMTGRRSYSFELREVSPRILTETKEYIGPFVGEPMTVPGGQLEPWTEDRSDAVNRLLDERDADRDDDGYSIVTFPEETEVQICFGYNCTDGEGAEVNIYGERVSEEVAGFLIELFRTADQALVPDARRGVPPALVGPLTDPGVRDRWPDAVVIQTPAEMIAWLERVGGHREVI
jgi:hypothetical protein